MTSLCIALGAAFVHRGLRPLVVEADPAGGVIGLRFALSADPSLRTLWADMRRGFSAELMQQNTLDLRGIDCLLAPTDPLLAVRSLDHVVPILAREVAGLGRPVIIDLGRISDASQALDLVGCATDALLVTRPRAEDAQSLLYGSRLLEANGLRPSIVSIGDGPHHPAEIASLAGLSLAAVLPDDRIIASAFSGGRFRPRKLRRSTLWRCVSSLADQLAAGSLAPDPIQAPTSTDAGSVVRPPAPYAEPGTTSDLSVEPAPMPIHRPEVTPMPMPMRQRLVAEFDPEATVPRHDIERLVNAGAQ